MTIFPSLRRCLWYVAFLFLLVLVWFVAIHIEQRMLRYRAENLLVDLRSFELRKTTFAQAQ